MAFCRKCGSKISEETKFCPNCGASTGDDRPAVNKIEEPVSKIDQFGKFYGIVLLIIAILDLQSDPAIVTLFVSVAVIVGCIFCLGKKYKLKGFTIVALIIAILCLLLGFSQGKKIGMFTMPGNEKVAEDDDDYDDYISDLDKAYDMAVPTTPVRKNDASAEKAALDSATQENIETEVAEVTTEAAETQVEEAAKETEDGVDPDLKAFLDSYEEFMDEYVEFMKKYMNDPGNAIALLSEYTKIMEKYEDFTDKINKYDSNTMSTEDAKYYLDVVNRCNKKLLEIY